MARGNTNVKKLMDKAKRKALANKLGTCKRFSAASGAVEPIKREPLPPMVRTVMVWKPRVKAWKKHWA